MHITFVYFVCISIKTLSNCLSHLISYYFDKEHISNCRASNLIWKYLGANVKGVLRYSFTWDLSPLFRGNNFSFTGIALPLVASTNSFDYTPLKDFKSLSLLRCFVVGSVSTFHLKPSDAISDTIRLTICNTIHLAFVTPTPTDMLPQVCISRLPS